MRRALVALGVALLSCGGEQAHDARAPKGPDVGWIASKKLDADLQEFLLRHYDEQLAFAFRIRAASFDDEAREAWSKRGITLEENGEGEAIARCRPADLDAVVGTRGVTAVTCASPPTASPALSDDAWRKKVEPDVRTVHAAGSACSMPVYLRFEGEVGEGARAELEALGAAVRTIDARSAIAFVPIRSIPHLAALAFVASVERVERAYVE